MKKIIALALITGSIAFISCGGDKKAEEQAPQAQTETTIPKEDTAVFNEGLADSLKKLDEAQKAEKH